jgi:hypothetical protein
MSSPKMLRWQYDRIMGQLDMLAGHYNDPDCPCTLGEHGEYCTPKHLLDIYELCMETRMMVSDAKLEKMFDDIATDAKGFRELWINKLHGKEAKIPDLAMWARNKRKPIELLVYEPSKAGMKQEAPAVVRIAGKCSGGKCDFKVKASKDAEGATNNPADLAALIEKTALEAIKCDNETATGATTRPPEPTRRIKAANPAAGGNLGVHVIKTPVNPISNLTTAIGSTGTRYQFKIALLPMKDVLTSHDPLTFAPTPGYPQELQPRLRDRAATRLQVKQIAQNLDPELLLTDFHALDRGLPIVGWDGAVESGNGRVMAIKLAYSEFPDKYLDYMNRATAIAESMDLIDKVHFPTNPILVRARITQVDRKAFVEEANSSPAIERSSVETARTDAGKITPEMLGSFFTGDMSIEEAIRSPQNKGFVTAFLGKLPANDQARLVDAHGGLSQDGVRRIVLALFVTTFPGDTGLKLAESFFESTDLNVKNVLNGIAGALGRLARAEALTAAGVRAPDLAIGNDLAKVVSVFSRIKRDTALTVQKYLHQGAMFEKELNDFQEVILAWLDDNSRSGKKIGDVLRAYADAVINSPPPNQGMLIAGAAPTKAGLWQAAVQGNQAGLFQDKDSKGKNIELPTATTRSPIRISGKCDHKADKCAFKVSTTPETRVAGSIQEMIDVALEMGKIKPDKSCPPETPCPPEKQSTSKTNRQANPITMTFSGRVFDLAPETVDTMIDMAANTTEHERGMGLCKSDKDGLIRPGVACVGEKHCIHIDHSCKAGEKITGNYHTHPNISFPDELRPVIQKSHSSGDLINSQDRGAWYGRDYAVCVSGNVANAITCAVVKPGNPHVPNAPGHSAPYIHPDEPAWFKEKMRKERGFHPNVGKHFDFVEIRK